MTTSNRAPLELKIIVGSTRPTRAVDAVAPWVESAARAHGAFAVDVLDLRDWPLPLFAEHAGTIGDITDPTYSEPLIKTWNDTITSADAFVVLTPEYTHSIPGVLKNAIDSVFLSYGLRNKPVVAVGYSTGIGGGIRAIEHLAAMLVEAEAAPLRNTVVIPAVESAFDGFGNATDPVSDAALGIALDDLEWWGRALRTARGRGELLPGQFRLRAAMEATSVTEHAS